MDADELASLTQKLSMATKNMREEAKQREDELAATSARVTKECQAMRVQAQADCDGLRAAGEAEMTMMLTVAHEEVTAMKEKSEKEKEEWEEEKRGIALVHRYGEETVTFSIGGTPFSMYTKNLEKRQNSKTLLAQLLNGRHKIEAGSTNEPIFIDRDSHMFRYLAIYLRSPEQFRLPKEPSEIEQMVVEALSYNMPPAFYGKLEGESVVRFTDFSIDSIHLPDPTAAWDQSMSLAMFDDEEAPVILHFDGKSEGIIQFNSGEPFVKLQIRNGMGMRFSIQALEDGVWEQVADYRLKKTGWNDVIEWEPRKTHAVAWRLVLKKNTNKNWLQNFRWWKLRETTTWEPHAWAKAYLSEADVLGLRKTALHDFHHG